MNMENTVSRQNKCTKNNKYASNKDRWCCWQSSAEITAEVRTRGCSNQSQVDRRQEVICRILCDIDD